MPKVEFNVKPTPFFKLKKDKEKSFQMIDLKKQFGFLPERVIIERMVDRNNVIRLIAVLPDKLLKKEKDLKV